MTHWGTSTCTPHTERRNSRGLCCCLQRMGRHECGGRCRWLESNALAPVVISNRHPTPQRLEPWR